MTVFTQPPSDVGDIDAGVIKEARTRQHRHRRRGIGITLIAAVITAVVLLAGVGGGGGIPPIVRQIASSQAPGMNLTKLRPALMDAGADYQVWLLPPGAEPTCVVALSLDPATTHGSSVWCTAASARGVDWPIYRNNPGGGVTVVGVEPGTASTVRLVSSNGAASKLFPVSGHAYLVTHAKPGDKLVTTTATGATVTSVISPAQRLRRP
jgi:hypothetical protein